ncbi:hypothetical protein [Acidovorax sp. FJL06]|uniref:hypothetical protein n=1 Tax=Acidovorax sp. FJL06 TaxID=2153365 RepID=UPI000F581965|nr:hypothetical protein [Acidovorax sp. FJL06]
MNNMQFDEATQTYRGTVELYRWNDKEQGQTFMGVNKPLQITPESTDWSYRDLFASYWPDQLGSEGIWESFSVKPGVYIQQHQTQNPLAQATDGALQQLMQAMARFSPAPVADTGGMMVGAYAGLQMLGVDGGN